MRRFPAILVLSLCLVPHAIAVGPDSAAMEKSTRKSDLSSDLDSFVRGAINKGLLTPAGEGHPESDGPAGDDDPVSPPVADQVKSRALVAEERYSACDRPYALDFTPAPW